MRNIFNMLASFKYLPSVCSGVLMLCLALIFGNGTDVFAEKNKNAHSRVSYNKVYLEGNRPSIQRERGIPRERGTQGKRGGVQGKKYGSAQNKKYTGVQKKYVTKSSSPSSLPNSLPSSFSGVSNRYAPPKKKFTRSSGASTGKGTATLRDLESGGVSESYLAEPALNTVAHPEVYPEVPMARLSSSRQALSSDDYQYLDHVGPFLKKEGDSYYEIGAQGDKMYLTLNPRLQEFATDLLARHKVPWGTIVAIEPASGKVRALAGHSEVSPMRGHELVSQSTFPAASLFKIITAAAAVETSGVTADTNVRYRGGMYTLNKHNYLPNPKTDKTQMKLSTALGKSCNPAFARIALNNLSVEVLTQYAANFGFMKNITADFPVSPSTISLKQDRYELARTAAGFGSAYMSPVHAAAMTAALGNKGLMMQPYIVDMVVDKSGRIKVHKGIQVLDQIVLESTADEVIRMMKATTTEGTGVKQFKTASPQLKKISIASKTGTLSGSNPKGRYYWFVAAAPAHNPTLAIASLVIDNGSARINGVGLGRLFLEHYFQSESLLTNVATPSQEQAPPEKVDEASVDTVAATDFSSLPS